MFMFKHPTGKLWKQRLVLKIPIIKGIVDYAILERFCRILSAMVKAGVPLPEGLKTTTEACSNIVYRERLEVAREQMLEGRGFSGPLIETELFPGAARQMFKVGEETGTLDDQLETASIYFDRELESSHQEVHDDVRAADDRVRRRHRRLRRHRARVGHVRRARRHQGEHA